MNPFVILIVLLSACASAKPTSMHPLAAPDLLPIDDAGDTRKTIDIGNRTIQIGLLRKNARVIVVRLDGRNRVELFAPAAIPGVPTNRLDSLKYSIDNHPENEQPGTFILWTSVPLEGGRTVVTASWFFQWNPARSDFDFDASPLTSVWHSNECLGCLAHAAHSSAPPFGVDVDPSLP